MTSPLIGHLQKWWFARVNPWLTMAKTPNLLNFPLKSPNVFNLLLNRWIFPKNDRKSEAELRDVRGYRPARATATWGSARQLHEDGLGRRSAAHLERPQLQLLPSSVLRFERRVRAARFGVGGRVGSPVRVGGFHESRLLPIAAGFGVGGGLPVRGVGQHETFHIEIKSSRPGSGVGTNMASEKAMGAANLLVWLHEIRSEIIEARNPGVSRRLDFQRQNTSTSQLQNFLACKK